MSLPYRGKLSKVGQNLCRPKSYLVNDFVTFRGRKLYPSDFNEIFSFCQNEKKNHENWSIVSKFKRKRAHLHNLHKSKIFEIFNFKQFLPKKVLIGRIGEAHYFIHR